VKAIWLIIVAFVFVLTPMQSPAQVASDSLLLAGHVDDERGNPIAGVGVTATYRLTNGGFGYIADTKTDQAGDFKIEATRAGSGATLAYTINFPIRLDFQHKNYLYGRLEDVRLFSDDERADLRITLRDGKSVRAKVVDSSGKPVAGARVQAIFGEEYDYRKSALSGPTGDFNLRGLPSETADLQAITFDLNSPILSGHVSVDLLSNARPTTITVTPFELPQGAVVRELLGMKLVDVDKEIQSKLFLYWPFGVVVLDPGPNSVRLDIGNLQRGDVFWMAGNTRVHNTKEFAQVLLASRSDPKKWNHNRVVYNSDRPNGSGSSTQYIVLTQSDLAELKAAAK